MKLEYGICVQEAVQAVSPEDALIKVNRKLKDSTIEYNTLIITDQATLDGREVYLVKAFE